MTLDQLMLILKFWRQPEIDASASESAQSEGSTYLRERLAIIAERACRDWAGDLVEIGCLNGSATVRLAQVARIHNRRVIAVDPFIPNSQNISADAREYKIFKESIKPYEDVIDFLKKDSRDPEVAEYLRTRELAFCYIDGLHEYGAVVNDIKICFHSKLLAIDDWTWNNEVKQGWYDATGNRARVELPYLHEGYLI